MSKKPEFESYNWIPGYENYTVSDYGRIYNSSTREYIKPYEKNGYLYVDLCKNGEKRHCTVSRLVATAFCKNLNPEEFTEVDHINGNTKDNRAVNLEKKKKKTNIERRDYNRKLRLSQGL